MHGSTSGENNFTSTDKLYLLSTKEIWDGGTDYDTAEVATRQLDYYKNKGVTISNYSLAIKKNGSNNANSWLRSARSFGTQHFLYVNSSGYWGYHYAPTPDNGVSPAFRIG